MRKWACAPRGFCWQFFPEGMHCIRCRDRGREANSASQAKQAKQCESRCESSQGRGWLSPTRRYATWGLFWPCRQQATQSQQQATEKTKSVSQARRIPTHSLPFCPSISQTPTLPPLHRQCYRPLCIKMPKKNRLTGLTRPFTHLLSVLPLHEPLPLPHTVVIVNYI